MVIAFELSKTHGKESAPEFARDPCMVRFLAGCMNFKLKLFKIIIHIVEVALGGKTGESRSLIDGPDKEEKMKLPNPPPLGMFGPLFSVRR